jgi:putative membrane protein
MRSFPAALLLSAIAAPALAAPQNPAAPAPGNPAVTSPRGREMGPGAPGPAEVNNPDRSFARAAAAGGLAEVDFGRLAEKKASAQPVKEFGQLMIRDYGPANGRLANLAKAQVLSLPGALDREDQLLRGNLEKTSGAQFDDLYIGAEIAAHQKMAQLLEYEIGSGQNSELKAFASDLLPLVLQHLRTAQSIWAARTGEAKTSAMPGGPAR